MPTSQKTQKNRSAASQSNATFSKRYRRWKRRMARRYPIMKHFDRILQIALILIVAVVVLLVILSLRKSKLASTQTSVSLVTRTDVATAAPEPTATPEAAASVEPTVTAEPAPSPTHESREIDGLPEAYYYQSAQAGADYSDNAQNGLITERHIYVDGSEVSSYNREEAIHMPASAEYSVLDGVTTFRGNNYRDGSSYGIIPDNPSKLTISWSKRIGSLDDWGGVGWTGQASAVRWPEETRLKMNINSSKKSKYGLIECIYATLDGNIYFFDMEDGESTRNSIDIGAPIKGSVTVDPRGYPLLYCGQGIYEVGGRRKNCGTRVWSLYDQSLIWAINGKDDLALRQWQAFDCSPLVDPATDTLIQAGENGVLYTLKLNTQLSDNAVTVQPETVRYVYDHSLKGKIGTENSIACYNNYVYLANNSGVIQCIDLNTQELVWSINAKDDIDASMAIEVEESGLVALYATNELDIRGTRGTCQMFKINALTGELIWYVDSAKIYQHNENGGGSFASPAIGKQSLSDLVYFHVCRTEEKGGILYAIDKQSGEIAWQYGMGKYGWSSPVCLYTRSGKGYVLVGSSDGSLRLFDGLSGAVVANADLGSNIEGTPVVFDDMIVVGTRGKKIYGLKIS